MNESRPSTLALLAAGAFFMENLGATVIVTALPRMAGSFRADPIELNIGVSAYVLTLAVLIPVGGLVRGPIRRPPDLHQRDRGVHPRLDSVWMCNDLWSFTAAWVMQGVGGAMMMGAVGRLPRLLLPHGSMATPLPSASRPRFMRLRARRRRSLIFTSPSR